MRQIGLILAALVLAADLVVAQSGTALVTEHLQTRTNWNFDGVAGLATEGPQCVRVPRPLPCGEHCFRSDAATVSNNPKGSSEIRSDLSAEFLAAEVDIRKFKSTLDELKTTPFQEESKQTEQIFLRILKRLEHNQILFNTRVLSPRSYDPMTDKDGRLMEAFSSSLASCFAEENPAAPY